MPRIGVLLAAVVLILIIAPHADAERIPIPDGVFYYKPAASVFGAEGVWNNPSVLGRFKPISTQFMGDITDDNLFRSWGGVISRKGLAVAYRYLDNADGANYREYIFAGGLPLGHMISVGGSYRYFASGPGVYENRHFWNLALSSHGSGPFAVAAVWSNLNRGIVDGERTEIDQRYSLAYRPRGKKITASVDMFLSTGQKLSNADFVYHIEVTPIRGLYVEASMDSDENFQIGMRTNLLQYFTGAQSNFDDDFDYSFTTLYAGATAKKQPSMIDYSDQRLSLSVGGGVAVNPQRYVFGPDRMSFGEMILAVYRAAEDASVSEMVLKFDRLGLGFAQAQELRDALGHFRERDKTIVCHITQPNNIAYYVASACDSILIPPVSRLNLVGLRAELTFYAGTMKKIGVEADVMRIGKYKRGAERWTREASSEEGREATNNLLDELYDQFVSAIADGRGWSADSVRALIDRGPFTSAEAMETGLVDGLSYRDRLVKNKFLRSMAQISFRRYVADTLLNDGWPRLPEIAVVFADGEITDGITDPNPFGGDGRRVTPGIMDQAFARARNNFDVRGIVFRINSPGGLALAGEQIHHDVSTTAERKPIVVSMGNSAASGAYHIAMAARPLFASPATITGSIGIYGGKADLSGLYEKIDLGKELYVRGRHAGMWSWSRPFTESEREKYYSHLQAFYDHFISLVSENRGMSTDSIDALGRGRVWTGREALANGLVDRLGGLHDAIEYIAREHGLTEYRVVTYPARKSLFPLPDIPFGGFLLGLFGRDPDTVERAAVDRLDFGEGRIFARLPYDIDIR